MGVEQAQQAQHAVVQLQDVSYQYPSFCLGPLTLSIPRGARCALVGRNGAGKTTLLTLLSGLRAPQAGRGEICGADIVTEPIRVRECVALTGDAARGLPWMTLREHFDFLAKIYPRWRMNAALDLAGSLDVPLEKSLASMSRGTSVKAGLCAAWGQGAALLLLDEPTAGLDPIARVEFLREFEQMVSATGEMTIVLATHILEDLDYLSCSDFLLLREGALEHVRPSVPVARGRGASSVRALLGIDIEASV